MVEVMALLRANADDIDDTARRCTDPVIVSELQHISSLLREKAASLEGNGRQIAEEVAANDTDFAPATRSTSASPK